MFEVTVHDWMQQCGSRGDFLSFCLQQTQIPFTLWSWNQSHQIAPEALHIWAQFPVCYIQYINSGLCWKCMLFMLCAVQWTHNVYSRILHKNWALQLFNCASVRGCNFILEGITFKSVQQQLGPLYPKVWVLNRGKNRFSWISAVEAELYWF